MLAKSIKSRQLLELFNTLATTHTSSVCNTPEHLQGSSIDMLLGDRRIMQRLPRKTVVSICKSARGGDLKSMLTLSMMYSVGLGVPKDAHLSICWASMSILEAPPTPLKEIYDALRSHVLCMTDDFVYPTSLTAIHNYFRPPKAVSHDQIKKLNGRYRVSPVYSGMPINLVYRFAGGDCFLYDVFFDKEKVLLDKVHRLDIPKQFGVIRSKSTIDDYRTRAKKLAEDDTLDLIVISGTLVVPRSLRSYVRNNYPKCSSVYELFNAFLEDNRERKNFVDPNDIEGMQKDLESTRKLLGTIKDGTLESKMRSEYNRKRKNYKATKDLSLKDDCLRLKAEHQKLKSGALLQECKDTIRRLKASIETCESSQEQDKLNHKYSYLENVFQFVATTAYYYNEAKKRIMLPITSNFKSHMSSLGFDVSGILESVHIVTDKFDTKTVLSKLRDPEYVVRGLVFQPIDVSVNSKALSINIER